VNWQGKKENHSCDQRPHPAVPSKITLPLLLAEIRNGNPDADITILIATACTEPHGGRTGGMFGDSIVDSEKIAINDASIRTVHESGNVPSARTAL
jgi:hypothetical protein